MLMSKGQQKRRATIIEMYGSLDNFESIRKAKRKATLIERYGENYQVAFGKQAAATNKLRYGSNFYTLLGREGGLISRGGGFAANHELASIAGKRGGQISRRGKKA